MRWPLNEIFAVALGAGLALTAVSMQLQARDYSTGGIRISHSWALPSLGKQRIGVAYFTLHNSGPDTDRLLGIDLPDGGKAQLHNSQIENDIMRMRPVDAAAIPAGGELVLKPGGMHVMLSDLPGPLMEGGQFRLRLHFEKAAPLEEAVTVVKRTATQTSPSPHSGH